MLELFLCLSTQTCGFYSLFSPCCAVVSIGSPAPICQWLPPPCSRSRPFPGLLLQAPITCALHCCGSEQLQQQQLDAGKKIIMSACLVSDSLALLGMIQIGPGIASQIKEHASSLPLFLPLSWFTFSLPCIAFCQPFQGLPSGMLLFRPGKVSHCNRHQYKFLATLLALGQHFPNVQCKCYRPLKRA